MSDSYSKLRADIDEARHRSKWQPAEDENGDLPVWARILWRYGIIGTIALGLTAAVVYAAYADLGTIKDEQRAHARETAFYLRAICINSAHDEAGRAACIWPSAERKP